MMGNFYSTICMKSGWYSFSNHTNRYKRTRISSGFPVVSPTPFSCGLVFLFPDEVDEIVEKEFRISRTTRGFGMELGREEGL